MQKMVHSTEGMPLFSQWALALQHLLAVFSGTLIVPMVTGLPVPVTLLFTGIATLIFQFFTRGKIALFYSCNFGFIGGTILIRDVCVEHGMTTAMGLCYASFGILVAGFCYILLAQAIRYVSYQQIVKIFSPSLYGPFIMALGIVLLSASFDMINTNKMVAAVSILVTIAARYLFRGLMRLTPINVGIFAATVVSVMCGDIDLSHVADAPWIAQPFDREYMALTVFEDFDASILTFSIFTMLPLLLVSIVEHVADVLAISRTVKIDYLRSVGLSRTLSANGLSTMLSTMFGAPATTSFSQTTGLIALNRICSTRLLSMAAVMMIFLAFSPKVAALLAAIPAAAIGGATMLMYCMVILVGLRAMVDAKVDMSDVRNLIVFSVVLVLTVGIKYGHDDSLVVCGISLSALTVGGLTGTILNIILRFKKDKPATNSQDEKVS